MLLITITFETINTSLQVGDNVYYVPTSTQGSTVTAHDEGFLPDVRFLGSVFSLQPQGAGAEIGILYDENEISAPQPGDFLMFAKDKRVNTSNLVGYYADIKFSNNSNERIELFSVGSEVFESSK
tara:strand:+ start:1907 stop:2281 length:375 start_codon:yes stop_codon:yes gene_type:complete